MEIYMIDESIVTPWQENSRPIIPTVERSIVKTTDIVPISAEHSSTSSDDDTNAPVYLDDGYEHAYNTLLTNNLAEDEHVYLTPKKTSNNENATPSENAACRCSSELTEQDSSPDQADTHYEEKDGDNNN
ncbi:uncharacterized protein LOC134699804 [Mytilus trossulus]|uniref:uncharacterized protein LOC134699804 n=1 Tax=Mytilus trossulus TaxID=6551 RepID=UPI0030060458